MHEARIEVAATVAGSFEIRLIDVTAGEQELAREPAGTAFAQGFPDLVLEDGGAPLTAAALAAAYAAEPTLLHPARYGQYLFRLLTPGTIGPRWKQLRDQHPNGLTTLLELRPETWQKLPWELLHGDDRTYWFQHRRHPMGLRVPHGAASRAAPRWPLRMLVLIGCLPGESIYAKAEQELLEIRRAIGAFALRIDLKVRRAPLTKLEAGREIEIFRPHLLHFIGHGATDDGGSLSLSQPGKGGSVAWQHAEIAGTLGGLHPDEVPRLAVINACQSAIAGEEDDASVASAFARIGCPAVIAMQGDILGNAAAAFSKSFYGSLAELGMDRVGQAFSRALQDVAATQGLEQRVWSLPRIYYQETAAKVFPSGSGLVVGPTADRFRDLQEIRPFVDRDQERFELYHKVDCWLDAPERAPRALLVKGAEGSGKSWLLKAIVYAALLRGCRAAYHDFRGGNIELETLLATLRHGLGDAGALLSGPLVPAGTDPNPFHEFDQPAGGAAGGNEDPRGRLFQHFLDGLKKTAEAGTVLLAFDNISHLKACKAEATRLFAAGSRGSEKGGLGPNVRMVLAASPADLALFGWDVKFDAAAEFKPDALLQVELGSGEVQPELFEECALRYCLQRLKEDADTPTKLAKIPQRAKLFGDDFIGGRTPFKLAALEDFFRWV